jgi:hypothetical protein
MPYAYHRTDSSSACIGMWLNSAAALTATLAVRLLVGVGDPLHQRFGTARPISADARSSGLSQLQAPYTLGGPAIRPPSGARPLKNFLSECITATAAKLTQVEAALLRSIQEPDCLLEEAIDHLPDELAYCEVNSSHSDVVISVSGAVMHHPMCIKKKA